MRRARRQAGRPRPGRAEGGARLRPPARAASARAPGSAPARPGPPAAARRRRAAPSAARRTCQALYECKSTCKVECAGCPPPGAHAAPGPASRVKASRVIQCQRQQPAAPGRGARREHQRQHAAEQCIGAGLRSAGPARRRAPPRAAAAGLRARGEQALKGRVQQLHDVQRALAACRARRERVPWMACTEREGRARGLTEHNTHR